MSKSGKPTPPPLDEAEQNAAAGGGADAPHAESGKATAEDAARASAASAAEAAAAARISGAASVAPPLQEVPAAAAGKQVLSQGQVIADSKPRAQISQRSGQFLARPAPTEPLSATEPVVLSNWVGRYKDDEGQPCPAYVKYGTPVAALPADLVKLIRETRGQVVGPIPPKAPPNPFTP